MEYHRVDWYTRFPELGYGDEPVPRTTTVSWGCNDSHLGINTLVLSWATILGGITAEDIPVFDVDNEPVGVDLSTGRYQKAQVDETHRHQPGFTGIFTKESFSSSGGCALEIRYCFQRRKGQLVSSRCTTASYLAEVARQLEYEVYRHLTRERPSVASESKDSRNLSVLNPNPRFLPGPPLLHELVRATGREANPAIEFLESDRTRSRLSYELLHARTAKLSSRIIASLKSRPALPKGGAVVPVFLPQSLDLYVSWLAILKAGAAVCPVNLDTPKERLNFIVNDVAADIVITRSHLAGDFGDIDRELQIITPDEEAELTQTETIESLEISPDALAYVMYTSGSTGLPKGVGISHRSASQSLLAHERHIPEFRRFLQFASPTFDVSVFEIFFPLFRGATLVGCERGLMLNDLVGSINELTVDAAELTPTVAGELLRTRTATPGLKVLLTIGEMLTRHVIDEFGFCGVDDGVLYGMYGPTEATIHCTVAAKLAAGSRVGNIGVPLDPVSAFIISPDQSEGDSPMILSYGHVGELAVGGPQIAIGYLNRQEDNKRAFVDSALFGRLYRTGDKARLHPNGELECLGRITSSQIKLRGQRLELGEVESILTRVAGVRSVAVAVLDGMLIAFVSGDNNCFSSESLRLECQRWLPKFMVPGDIICMNELPRLQSGKIDKKGLERDYTLSKGATDCDSSNFQSELEKGIARCAENVLGSPVNRSGSLALSGLDSLRAIKLVSNLRAIGVHSDVVSVLEADTVGLIASSIPERKHEPLAGEKVNRDAGSQLLIDAALDSLRVLGCSDTPQAIVSCSPIQAAMVLESMRNPRVYSNWVELEFGYGIGVADMKTAFSTIAQANEILRSGFVQVDVPGYSHAQVIWSELDDACFAESVKFDYDLSFSNQKDMLSPFKVELIRSADQVRALVHIHHALYDGWSWDLIKKDLADSLTGQPLMQRPQYRLFNEYYTTDITADEAEAASRYWGEQLEDAVPLTWPNFQKLSDAPMRLRTTRRDLSIRVRHLDAAVSELQVSRLTVFQGAFAYLLSTYLGTSDALFGTVSSGRTARIAGIEDMIGPCIATVPLRLNLANLRNIRDLLTIIHNLNRKSLKNGFLPLRDIKKASRVDSGIPLFDSLFIWQDGMYDNAIPSAIVREVHAADFLEFAMTVEIEVRGDKLYAKANFQESIIPARQADMFLHQLEELAALFIRSPDLILHDVNALLPSSTLSTENLNYIRHDNLPSLAHGVERLAKSEPGRVAIEILAGMDVETGVADVQTLSYAELDAKSNKLANYLNASGLLAGGIAAIVLEKSLDLYVSILSIIKAGAGYVPITPQTPSKRVNAIIREANCGLCVSNSAFSDVVEKSDGLQILNLDSRLFESFRGDRPPSPNADSSLAYAVFTSGSTGVPKGVLVSHHNLQSNLVALSEIYPHGDSSKLLQACSHAFDVSVFEIFYAWNMGMTLSVVTNDILFRDIEKVIRCMDITHLSLTPTVAALVSPENVPKVEFLVTAGEGMTSKVLKDWADRGLYQGYGPSETTNICTVEPNFSASNFPNNIGKPLRNTSAFVISEEDGFSLVPRGGLGEFCFGGTQVGLGYLNMPELSREKFFEHPEYGRLYRSGDFGRMLPDGSLAFTGRHDDLIKLRGQRIELGEINSALLDRTAVKDCTTMICEEDGSRGQQLVSFWIPSDLSYLSPSGSKELSLLTRKSFDRIGEALPTYMVPSFLIPVPYIPITTTGKIDKRALLERFSQLDEDTLNLQARSNGAEDDETQFSGIESKMGEIISTITQSPLAEIGRHSSFYRLGLDSISAIALSKQLKRAGFGQIDISVIMRNDSVARLARVVERRNGSDTRVPPSSSPKLDFLFSDDFIEQVKHEAEASGEKVLKILPCTPLQEAMLLDPSSDRHSAYFNHLNFEVRGDIYTLRNAWNTMVRRYDILRARFKATNDARFSWVQVVLEENHAHWDEIDVSSFEADTTTDELKSKFMRVEGSSLIRFAVLTDIETGIKQLHLFIHHALYDGEAMEQLLYDVEEVVHGHELPPVVPYDLYLEQMVSADVDLADQFWRGFLAQLSTDHLIVPASAQGAQEGRQFRCVSDQLAVPLAEIEGICKRMSVTLLNVLQAAWARLIAHYSGTSDICFGEVFSCRSIPVEGSERIVGPCFNTLPVRIKVGRDAVNLDLMKHLQGVKAEILPYQLTSLRRLQSRFSTGGGQLFDTLLLFQRSPRPLDEKVWKLVEEMGDMDFPLVIEITPNQQTGTTDLYLHFDQTRTTMEDAHLVLTTFVKLAHHILTYPSARATDFSIIDDAIPSFIRIAQSERELSKEQTKSASHNESGPNTDEWCKEALEVRSVLSSLSKIERGKINIWTTIFQLGLDSINAIQVAHRLREGGYHIAASDVMEAASVGGISHRIQHQVPNGLECAQGFDFESFQDRHLPRICRQMKIPETDVQSIRPCTPTQAGMLAMFINSEGDLYFNTMSLRSAVPLDLPRLRIAWAVVVDRNEMLRTGFCHVMDDRFPFAMVTYLSGAFTIPWHEGLASQRGAGEVHGRSALSRLHQPPWSLTFEQSEAHTTVHFTGMHALYDAHSLSLIFSEVSQVYQGNVLPAAAPIEPILGPVLAKGLREDPEEDAFWQELGQGFRLTTFPDMNPVHAARQEIHMLSKLCSKPLNHIQDGCRDAGITVQAAGQAAWARLLASYTGESEVTYGVVLSGRTTSIKAQDVVFPCLTTLPSSYQVEGCNQDLLHRIMEMDAKLIKNQFTPLSKIQRLAGFDSSLFDTLFVFQKLSSTANDELWNAEEQVSKTDYVVSIELIPIDNHLKFSLTFKNSILPERQAEILLCQLDSLLIDTIFSPASNCSYSGNASGSITSIVPRKELRLPSRIEFLHQFVEVRAQEEPFKIALEFASRSSLDGDLTVAKWTYKDLDDWGNRYANVLRQRGASAGDLIGICFDKCPEAYFAVLAVLKLGCAYVALDPGAPFARKQFISEDSGARLLLCTSQRQSELNALAGVIVLALDEQGILDGTSADPPVHEPPISSDATCYCLYTSGSTGTPKGCEITHDNAIQALLSFQRLFAGHWDESSRWLQFAAFHFDVSVLEQYWSWSVGICVTSCPRDILFEDLPGIIQQLEITHIDLTPSLARLVHPNEVPSLCRGVFITGGEQLKQEILNDWGEHRVIYNGYGPTEVTIGCTMLPRVSPNDKPSNIGPQFDNVSSVVFKPGTETSVLRGGIGELCVSGPLVGRGYLNRPQLTSEKFQYIEEFDERVYRTGDLVRLLHDESFCFLGRVDDQVKLRGQRLEIGEINHVIKAATDDIGEVMTTVLKHSSLTKEQLVSFVNVENSNNGGIFKIDFSTDANAVIAKVRRACHASLPGYMVPTNIVPLNAFPLSANNKIDARQLKELYSTTTLDELQRLSPLPEPGSSEMTNEIEEIIHIVATVIGCDEKSISSWSNIFELGLDSISAISFTQALKAAGFDTAQPSIVMKNPIISVLADALTPTTGEDSENEYLFQEAKQRIAAFSHMHLTPLATGLKILPESIEAVAPCTPLQEGIIYRNLQSEKFIYLSGFNFTLDPDVNISRLKLAWEHAQEHVQLLRTKFLATDDGYALVVLKNDNFPWFNLSSSNDEDLGITAAKRHGKWRKTAMDFPGRLWEVGVISGPTGRWMCLNLFHALYDGNSLPLLLDLVAQAYRGIEVPRALSFTEMLPQGPLCRVSRAESFWVQHLESANLTQLVRIEDALSDGPSTSIIEIGDLDSLDSTRRKLNVTEQAVIHACWLYTFVRYFGFSPTLGMVVSGRALRIPGAENVVGPMFNTIPCYIPLFGLSSVSDLAVTCHEYHVSALPYQHTPLRDIMKWTRRSVDQPLFESLFVFQKDSQDRASPTEPLWTLKDSNTEADYGLAFEAQRDRTGQLRVTILAHNNVLSPEMADQLARQFKDTLLEFLNDPYKELGHLYDPLPLNGEVPATNDGNCTPTPPADLMVNGSSTFEWSDVARRIRQEIANLADVEIYGIRESTSIMEVGLDSIDAIKLSSRLRKAGIKLPVSIIMNGRTIQAMMNGIVSVSDEHDQVPNSLQHLEGQLRESLEKEGHYLAGIEHVLPATPLQEGMVAEMVASDYHRYFNHDVLEIEDHVDIEKLGGAWVAVVRAHPILRTSFAHLSEPGLPFSYAQLVHNQDEKVCWSVEYTSEKAVEAIIGEERKRAKDCQLEKPPLRLRLVHSEGKRVLVISIAHALYDGWSLNLLHQDVMNSYTGRPCNRPSYHNFLEHIVNASGEKSSQFWQGALDGASPVPFPRQAGAGGNTGKVYRQARVSGISSSKVSSFCKKHGITAQCLGLTCWALVLAGYLGHLDVVFGTILLGRDVENAERIVFPAMNSIAFRSILHGTRKEMLKYMQEILSGIFDHQHFPLRKIKSLADLGSRDLFDTLFIYQKGPTGERNQAESLYKSVHSSSDVEFPVCVEVELVEETVVWRVACNDMALGERDTSNLLEKIENTLNDIIERSDDLTIQPTGDGISVSNATASCEPGTQPSNAITESLSLSESEWTNLEKKIRSVLSSVASVPEAEITKQTTLFHLGLDSISGIKVSSLLKKESVILAVSDLLRAGTVPNMARVTRLPQPIQEPNGNDHQKARLLEDVQVKPLLSRHNIAMHDVEDVMPATSGQMYMLEMRHSSNGQLFYPDFFYSSRGNITVERLGRSWEKLVQQLSILRTVFLRPTKSRSFHIQAVLKRVNNPIVWRTDLRNPQDRWHIERAPDSPPVTLYASQGSSETIIMLHLHHALYDAVSLSHTIHLFSRLCNDLDIKETGRIGMSDFIVFDAANSPLEKRKAFWKEYTAGLVTEGEWTGDPDGEFCTVGDYRECLVDNVKGMETVARKYSVTVQALFLAIYAKIHLKLDLAAEDNKEAPGEHVILGVYLANRSHPLDGLSDLIAPTLNIVPLCIRNPGRLSILVIAQQVQRDLQEIGRAENSGVSLVEIADWTGIKLDTFVNILKYPDPGSAGVGANDVGADQRIEFVPVGDQDFSVDGIGKPGDGGAGSSKGGGPECRDIFRPGLDIEAAIRNNGLDVGIFGTRERLDAVLSERVLRELRQEILSAVDELSCHDEQDRHEA